MRSTIQHACQTAKLLKRDKPCCRDMDDGLRARTEHSRNIAGTPVDVSQASAAPTALGYIQLDLHRDHGQRSDLPHSLSLSLPQCAIARHGIPLPGVWKHGLTAAAWAHRGVAGMARSWCGAG